MIVTEISRKGGGAGMRIVVAAVACGLVAACSSTHSGRSSMSGRSHVGVASWYGSDFHGRRTANGEVFDMYALSAAHPTLPLPSYVRVTNLANHRSLVLRVNDRGPFARGRVIDVSRRAAELLGFVSAGRAMVKVEYVGRARRQS